MRVPRFLDRLGPAGVVFSAVAAASVLMALAPAARAGIIHFASGVTPPPPSPTPTPVNATIGLAPTAGTATTQITVTGQLFLPRQNITLYWDDPSKVAGAVQADNNGAFTKVVIPFAGDQPGVHHICASVQPNPCAQFTLQTPPTPTPPESPSPTPTPEATSSPSPSPTPSPVAAPISGFDIISRPPFVFLPIIGALGLLGAIAYWAFSSTRRASALPAATVYHRSVRPTVFAPPGPPAPAAPLFPPVAQSPPETLAPSPSPPPEPPLVPPPPAQPGAPDAPPELPEPGE